MTNAKKITYQSKLSGTLRTKFFKCLSFFATEKLRVVFSVTLGAPAGLVGGDGGDNRRHLRQNHWRLTAIQPAAAGWLYLARLRSASGYPNISPSSANVYTLQLLISTAGGPTSVSATLLAVQGALKPSQARKMPKLFNFQISFLSLCTLQKDVGSILSIWGIFES